MTRIAHVSGGISSAAVYLLEVESGRPFRAVFANTNYESEDTYDFIRALEKAGGVKIDWLNNDGKDIWDVFIERKQMTAPKHLGGGCMASYHLKKVPLRKYSAAIPGAIDLIGYGPDEEDRVARLAVKNPGERFEFPLFENKVFFCEQKRIIARHGLTLPKAYREGMPHNNCNRQCIAAGIKFWALLWKDDPKRYDYAERREQEFLQVLRDAGRQEFTFLRDRRGGETKNMSLRDLRESLERGERFADERSRIPCSCSTIQLTFLEATQ